MIKIKTILFIIVVLFMSNISIAGQITEDDVLGSFLHLKTQDNKNLSSLDKLDFMFRDNLNRTPSQFYKKWEKYLKSVTRISNKNHTTAILRTRRKCIEAETEHEKVIRKFKKMSKDNNSSEWVKRFRKKITEKEMQRRRREIYDIILYFNNKSEYTLFKKTAQDLLYNKRLYFSLLEQYHDIFLRFYSTLSEKEKKKNIEYYNTVKQTFNKFETKLKYYEIVVVNKHYILFETVVKNLKNKDIYNLLKSEKVFQKPFDFLKLIDDLYSIKN
ncbi:MAG: hypothetical protein GY714_02910 [Desulfobacterales bacterium]|nr:hypothetical protein [Desulfobacterales bacterium]